MKLALPTLTGHFLQIEPLSVDHVHQLVVAANEDRTSYLWTPVPATVSAMLEYIHGLLADAEAGRVVPFAQRRLADQRVVGCTRFLEIRCWSGSEWPDEVEIGGTWLAASSQRTAANSEAKYLLLAYAFEVWNVKRLAICTDARNDRARTAIERLGVTFEGILRSHRGSAVQTELGQARDSALYSIVSDEWPAIRSQLRIRLYGSDDLDEGAAQAGGTVSHPTL